MQCRRTTYTCAAAFTATLNEAGSVRWVLLPSDAPWPSPALNASDVLTATNMSALFPAAIADGQDTGTVIQGDNQGLPSQSSYLLVAAAQDASGNVQELLSNLSFVAPDVRPPLFTGIASFHFTHCSYWRTS